MFDVKDFYEAHGIKSISEGHKHCRPGWVQVPCPFCTGNVGWHLGFNLKTDFYNCYRCGFHSTMEVIHTFLPVSWDKAKEIMKEYSTYSSHQRTKERIKRATEITIPSNGPLGYSYIRYLQRRNYNPYDIINKWDLVAGGPYGKQKHRIIAPITYNKTIVSYQGRDITEKSGIKYKACKMEEEIIHHKNILYGIDYAKRSCILVEGITDVWRLGYGAVASFGASMMKSQIFLLAEKFNKVFVMFDNGPTDKIAQESAEKIAYDLASMDVETELCLINGDPGDLSQDKADLYKKQLIG